MAVLAFFHARGVSKIPTVNFYNYFLSILFITFLCADNETAEGILLKSFHRMDGIDHRFKVDSKQSGKKKREKHFQASIHWPSKGEVLRKTRIKSIETKRKKPSSFWEHRYKDGTKEKKWMSLPVTGKLKDVSNKKSRKKDFSFAELGVSEENIRSHIHELLPQVKIDTFSVHVIESIELSRTRKVKETKKLWIDVDSYMILKVEFYTGSGRLFRSIKCSNFHLIHDILFPMSIDVQDLKSKTDIQITIKDIILNPEFDIDIFIPRDQ